jgi:hypothetical protein
MDLTIERTISKPFQLVEAALLSGPPDWLPGPREGTDTTAELDVRVGGSRIARRVVVRAGPVANAGEGRCRLPVAWQAAEHPDLYPRLEGALELTPVARRRTRLMLRARYRVPAAVAGEAVDRAVLHLVAEASVEAFVERIAAILERDAMSIGLTAAGNAPAGGG